ncbi:hypothetical protein BKA65DRAFT_488999 [Rhexocercosporidium sp. MPI-PUGE-AT-0058]|nr:hypothetical protein BKA65DRAFT_488999 [Rhexocercosporidium sp. MPI-PUGE-AT-0058]
MAPTAPRTRGNDRFTPPPEPDHGFPASTRKRTRFFNAFDRDHDSKSFRQICRDEHVKPTTGLRWKRQRENMGHMAMRTTRGVSKKLGRRSKVTRAMCQMLIDPKRNPVRDQLYEAQIEYFNLPVKRRQLSRKLKEHTNGGRRYKMAFVKKQVSEKNREERVAYGERHLGKTIHDFWACITFTDEAHVDPSSQAVGDILRERGTRYADENIMERQEKRGSAFHIAAWINWYGKSETLEFYNDEEDTIEQPPMLPKPRRRPTIETEAEYQNRVKEWDATRPHKVEKKVAGNHMTQLYYTERLLPVYIKAVSTERLRDGRSYYLQEDGDPSHGMRKDGLAKELKIAN